ncbi:amidohydrolase [Shewanella sp. 10N.286.51.B7]|uniref:amidohydrolase n=1 Tax=Shewanella sp. 10N.286.51.B7 TaxID=1880836 RepID=UPI000C8160F8|nr:amidohydrolase [Shewanella sp. 10N.286.51.B7]PMG74853.1 amidohydrolase [Shewanella sp. 10N.286.51.B7]
MAKFAPSLVVIAVSTALLGCNQTQQQDPQVTINKNPYPSTYQVLPRTTTLLTNATVLTGTGEKIEQADVLMVDGKIKAVGAQLSAELVKGATVVDATDKWITPGIIDVHSHLGVYPSPSADAHSDGNEVTNPNTAEVWAEHSVWPQDPAFNRAREGGVTTLQILPGSANLIGGRGVTLKNAPSTTMQGMKFPDAPYGLKMACGENPKGAYGRGQKVAPMTRMGNMAGYRQAFIEATEYKRAWDKYDADYAAGLNPEVPQRDLTNDTLKGVLEGEILIHNHCYKAEEMAMMVDLGKEFNYHSGTFHHAIEGYKIAELLAENGNCAAMWPDWWGFKMEANDMVIENVAMVDAVKNSCAVVHSDSSTTIQRLNQETAKIMHSANQHGFELTEEHVISWITSNAAKSLGIADKTGSLEAGKNADVVIWNSNPFSVYAKAEQVFIDGAKVFDRQDDKYQAKSDFMLGQK